MIPAAFFYLRVRRNTDRGIGKWVLQLRGGSDLTLIGWIQSVALIAESIGVRSVTQ